MKTKALLAIAMVSATLPLAAPAEATYGGGCGWKKNCTPTPTPPPAPTPTPVPEPADAALLLMGVAGVVLGRRMQVRKR